MSNNIGRKDPSPKAGVSRSGANTLRNGELWIAAHEAACAGLRLIEAKQVVGRAVELAAQSAKHGQAGLVPALLPAQDDRLVNVIAAQVAANIGLGHPVLHTQGNESGGKVAVAVELREIHSGAISSPLTNGRIVEPREPLALMAGSGCACTSGDQPRLTRFVGSDTCLNVARDKFNAEASDALFVGGDAAKRVNRATDLDVAVAEVADVEVSHSSRLLVGGDREVKRQFGPDRAPSLLAEVAPGNHAVELFLNLARSGRVHVAPPGEALVEVRLTDPRKCRQSLPLGWGESALHRAIMSDSLRLVKAIRYA